MPSATTDADSRLCVRFNADLILKIGGDSALADSSFYSTIVQLLSTRRPKLPCAGYDRAGGHLAHGWHRYLAVPKRTGLGRSATRV